MSAAKQVRATPAPASIPPRVPIKVKTLEFPHHQNFPGKTYSQTVTTQGTVKTSQWDIEYIPWQRCFRVVYTAPGSDTPKPHHVRYFSEVGACWSLPE